MSRIHWMSWSKEYAEYELSRLQNLDLKNEWVNGHLHEAGPKDIILTGNGQHRNKGKIRATLYYEPYIYLKNEFDRFPQDDNWHRRFVYNPDMLEHKGTVLVPFAGYWECNGKFTYFDQPRTTTFGMVLGNKQKPPAHPSDIGFMRKKWVDRLAGRSFMHWGPGWNKSPNYKGEAYFSDNKFVDSRRLLSRCMFGLAIDNSRLNGYLTEKLWSCLLAGTVPIYYGHESVFDTIPNNCFIYGYHHSIDGIVDMCEGMEDSEWFNYKDNIRAFLEQDQAHSWEYLFKRIDSVLGEST